MNLWIIILGIMHYFDGLIIILDNAKKESLNKSICQKKLFKLKCKSSSSRHNVQELCGNFKRCNKHIIGMSVRKRKKTEHKKYLK